MTIARPMNALAAHNNGVLPLPLYTHSDFVASPFWSVAPTHVNCNKIQALLIVFCFLFFFSSIQKQSNFYVKSACVPQNVWLLQLGIEWSKKGHREWSRQWERRQLCYPNRCFFDDLVQDLHAWLPLFLLAVFWVAKRLEFIQTKKKKNEGFKVWVPSERGNESQNCLE